jgi:hypothetical protein
MAKETNLPAHGDLQYITERNNFHSLLITNPNYFGNLKGSPYKPVLNFQSNTFYEQLGCVGFNPQLNRLDATITVKQHSGYNGALCSAGSREYVRFYLSFDSGVTWVDQGLTSVNVHDGATALPIQYDVSLTINPSKLFCFFENLPMARAILSWNTPPPANTPNYAPIWGNHVDAHIQIAPGIFFLVKDLVSAAKLALTPELTALASSPEKIPTPAPQPASYASLLSSPSYKAVPQHRSLYAPIQKLIQAEIPQTLTAVHPLTSALNLDLSKYQINPAGLINSIAKTNGDTTYEQLNCIGLSPQFSIDNLAGVLTVKKASGYSGPPCSSGSTEYVAFWLDFGSGWEYAGLTSVLVHDYAGIPAQGLEYSVVRPYDFSPYRKLCQDGPVEVNMRAILSWEVAPPTNNPNYVPTWGNHVDAKILLTPGEPQTTGSGYSPFMDTVGGMFTGDINASGFGINGRVSPTAGFVAVNSPFGGEIVIAGHIGNAPDISQGATPVKYRIRVSNDGVNYQSLTNTFTADRTQLQSGIWSYLPSVSQIADPDGYYTYQEDLITNASGSDALIFVAGNLLGRWETSASMTGLWYIKIEVKDPITGLPVAGPQNIAVYLDNVAPAVTAPLITSGSGPCGDFKPGDTIVGTYSASDDHFYSVSLGVLPSGGPITKSSVVSTPTSESGVWTWVTDLTTVPCGYVIQAVASDRTIVNSGFVGWTSSASAGLCIRPLNS